MFCQAFHKFPEGGWGRVGWGGLSGRSQHLTDGVATNLAEMAVPFVTSQRDGVRDCGSRHAISEKWSKRSWKTLLKWNLHQFQKFPSCTSSESCRLLSVKLDYFESIARNKWQKTLFKKKKQISRHRRHRFEFRFFTFPLSALFQKKTFAEFEWQTKSDLVTQAISWVTADGAQSLVTSPRRDIWLPPDDSVTAPPSHPHPLSLLWHSNKIYVDAVEG